MHINLILLFSALLCRSNRTDNSLHLKKLKRITKFKDAKKILKNRIKKTNRICKNVSKFIAAQARNYKRKIKRLKKEYKKDTNIRNTSRNFAGIGKYSTERKNVWFHNNLRVATLICTKMKEMNTKTKLCDEKIISWKEKHDNNKEVKEIKQRIVAKNNLLKNLLMKHQESINLVLNTHENLKLSQIRYGMKTNKQRLLFNDMNVQYKRLCSDIKKLESMELKK